MGSVSEVVRGIMSLISENIVAKTNVTSDVLVSDIVHVENSFHFEPDQEIILIDWGYDNSNYSTTSHYDVYEYARIKEVVDTRTIQLYANTESNWLVSDQAFIQKTIGHSPLYDDRIYYGDREVIPSEDMAVTVEPVSKSNEWIYIQGGLSEEYRVSIAIYGKDIETEEGMEILNKYSDAIYNLMNSNLHIDINDYNTPLLANVAAGAITVVVEDNQDNRDNILPSSQIVDDEVYEVQDNQGVEIDLFCVDVTTPGDGNMYVTLNQNNPVLYGVQPLNRSYNLEEYAVLRRHGRYFYDSRADNVEFGVVQKGSAMIRAAKINWFGKEVVEHSFPQRSKGVDYFPEVSP